MAVFAIVKTTGEIVSVFISNKAYIDDNTIKISDNNSDITLAKNSYFKKNKEGVWVRYDKGIMPIASTKTTIKADGIDIATISGVPKDTVIMCGDNVEIADGSDIEFSTDIIGEYNFKFRLFNYQEKEITINAV